MKIEDLAVGHPYYCIDSNYYSNDAHQSYESWESFYREFGDSDEDMNLIFRWDIKEKDVGGYCMDVFFMLQRKGIFMPVHIKSVADENAEQIHEFLSKRFSHLKRLWAPFNAQPGWLKP